MRRPPLCIGAPRTSRPEGIFPAPPVALRTHPRPPTATLNASEGSAEGANRRSPPLPGGTGGGAPCRPSAGMTIPAPPTAPRTHPRPPTATPNASEGGPGGERGACPERSERVPRPHPHPERECRAPNRYGKSQRAPAPIPFPPRTCIPGGKPARSASPSIPRHNRRPVASSGRRAIGGSYLPPCANRLYSSDFAPKLSNSPVLRPDAFR